MIDIPKFKSPSILCLAIGVSLIAWYYAHAFILIDKFLPLDFSTQEELLISKAELDAARSASGGVGITVIEAKFEAASYKRVELDKIMGDMFELHRLGLLVGLFFILFTMPVFCFEMAWQKTVFNKALKSDAGKSGAV
ncbi:hypothetical protein ACFSB1_01655 [Halopseudomonas phragmitis]|uniref:Uncharacterized protein n=1 Tax=Halopseudomonas phragmitis TaxID=1931241 RepID=A0A1V0B6V1_9GAMM|nr:hypothetical protein [Halopseudomonas phragmitis]AQZ95672.1 hypothetical protein BVH74_13340 [Halopseudomonas phragmitis]